MSKHNYTQYSNKKHNHQETAAPEIKMEQVAKPDIEFINETIDTVALPEMVEGVVVNCAKLNVRVEPDITSDVVCVLNAESEIEINVNKSTSEWFSVCTAAGIEGYCMRKFIDARL